MTLSHVHVLEAIIAGAFAAAEFQPTEPGLPGELSVRFRPGDALRAMGLKDGCRAWLRARLKELGSPIGDLPRALGGGEFSVLRTMATDTPSGKVFANAIVGRDADGALVRETIHASIWTIRLTAGYRAWMSSGASMRHSLLPQLRGLKCAAAEAVARYALTGRCSKQLSHLLLELGILKPGWEADTVSATYRSARRAIGGVLQVRPQLDAMGVSVSQDGSGCFWVRSSDEPRNCAFAPTGAVLVGKRKAGNNALGTGRSTTLTTEHSVATTRQSRFAALRRQEAQSAVTVATFCDLDGS